MEKQTLALLDSALEALRNDLSPRAAELAEKSMLGTLTTSEHAEFAEMALGRAREHRGLLLTV